MVKRRGKKTISGVCRYCGCTDEEGCPGGCGWSNSERDVCTACDDLAFNLGHAALAALVAVEGPIRR